MISTTNRQRVEKALQTVEGIHGSKSNLVIDDELMREVAASLELLEQIHHCKILTGISHEVVILNGEVSSMDVRRNAEQCAASHPKVRGVINYIRVPGVDLELQDHRLLQPPIGKEIYFLGDGIPGRVRQVVINPDNRRVVAMTIQGHYYNSRRNLTLSNNSGAQSAEQLLVIPMSIMGHLTKSSGFLTIQSTDFTKYQKFDASLFTAPNKDWVPPYPYCPDDVLFPVEYQQVDKKIENVPNQASSTLKMEEQVLIEQLLANDSLGG